MVSHWSLSDKSPQVSRTLLSILADLNYAVVWMVSTRPVISKSSSPCINPLVTVPRAPITIGIIVTFMFHSFFNFQARLRYLSLFSHSFNFSLWSAGTAKFTILQVIIIIIIIIIVVVVVIGGGGGGLTWSIFSFWYIYLLFQILKWFKNRYNSLDDFQNVYSQLSIRKNRENIILQFQQMQLKKAFFFTLLNYSD